MRRSTKRLACCLALLLLPLALFAGCDKEEDSAAPAANETAAVAPAPVDSAQPAVSGARPGEEDSPAADRPTPSGRKPLVVPDAGTVLLDAGPKEAGAPTKTDAGGGGGAKFATCLKSCEGSLRGCLIPGGDGGLGLPNLPKCQAAAEACRKACTP